jgi:hypothetical protein
MTGRGDTTRKLVAVGFTIALLAGSGLCQRAGAASTHSASADPSLVAARELVPWIPATHRYECEIDDLRSEQDLGTHLYAERAGLRTSLSCGADGHWTSSEGYATFTTTAAAERVFDGYTGNDESTFCKKPTTWSLRGHDVGRVACYETTNGGSSNGAFQYAVMVWTYAPLHLFAWAYDNENDANRLQEWWQNSAGPRPTPERVAGLPTTAPSAATAAELAAELPRTTRSTCSAGSLDEPPFDTQIRRSRLWIAAALTCRPRSGADSLFYVSMTPDALDDFFLARYYDAATANGNGDPCPAYYAYEMDDHPTGDENGLGSLACFSRGADTVVAWSVRRDHVVAEASGGDADAVLRFAGTAGPEPSGTFRPETVLKPG